jgi:hypothetical protein
VQNYNKKTKMNEFLEPTIKWHPAIELLLIVGAWIFSAILAAGVVLGIAYLMGIEDVAGMMDGQAASLSPIEINQLRWLQVIGHICQFLLPACLFIWIRQKTMRTQYLLLDNLPTAPQFSASVFWLLGSMAFIQFSYYLNQQIPLPEWATDTEKGIAEMVKAFLKMDTIGLLFFNLIVIAVVPAIGEEILFRGVIQRIMIRLTRNPHLGIWLTGIWFSAMHLQLEGFLPRMILGAMLGYLAYWSRSLWLPIGVHLLNNGLQVIAAYLLQQKIIDTDIEKIETFALLPTLVSTVLTLTIAYFLHNFSQKEQVEYLKEVYKED